MKVEPYIITRDGDYYISRKSSLEYGFQLWPEDGEKPMFVVVGEKWKYKTNEDELRAELDSLLPLMTMMAVAPKMLDALEDLLDLAEPMCVMQDDHTLVQARKAIAKAKGEKQ